MNNFSNLFSRDASNGLNHDISLINPVNQDGNRETILTYHGKSVQILDSPFSVLNSPSNSSSDTFQNYHHTYDLLEKYNIDTQENDITSFFKTIFSELTQLDIDQFPPRNSDNEPVIDFLTATPDTSQIQPVCLFQSEPEIRQATPDNPQDRLTVNPSGQHQTLFDDQTPPAEEIADGNSTMAERQRKRQRESKYERYRNDPAYAERVRKYQREYQRKRYQNNPEYAKRQREHKRERRKDPAYRELIRQRQRERYHNRPDFADRKKTKQRERYHNDPEFADNIRKRTRERNRELCKKAVYSEHKSMCIQDGASCTKKPDADTDIGKSIRRIPPDKEENQGQVFNYE